MSKKYIVQLICWSLLLPAVCNCTVLEDRAPCPGYLDIDYRQLPNALPDGGPGGTVEVAWLSDAMRWTVRHALSDCPSAEEVPVEKTQARAVAVVHANPQRTYLTEGTQILCEPGSQIGILYADAQDVDCSGEEACFVIQPHKQFSTLVFTDAGNDLFRQYDLLVRGTTCGFDAADLSALDGDYVCPAEDADGTGRIAVRIPRQKQGDMVLEFWSREDRRKYLVSPVGRYLFAAGYDPSAPDLPDYEIRVDFREALLYLRVADWDEEYLYSLY